MVNKIKYLLLGLLTPLLCGVSFGANFFDNTQFTSVYHSVCDKDTQNTSDCFFDAYYYSSNSSYNYKTFNNDWIYCLAITSNLTDNDVVNLNINNNLRLVFRYATYGYRGQYTSDTIYTAFWDYVGWKYLLRCSSSNKAWKNVDTLQLSLVNSSSNWFSSLSSLYDNWIYFEINVWYVPFTWFNNLPNNWGGSSCDYSDYESTINTLSWNYNTCLDTLNTRNWQVASLSWSLSTCQGSLSTCQWDLSSCSNGCDVMVNQCQESLSWCNTNFSSMTNYADSLSSQLNECLANSPEPCEGTWCDEIASGINAVFSFFWERDDQMFSLPIANNVFLPRWYRAYIDSWVVAISEYEKTSYSIDDSSFNEINKSFYSLIYGFIFLSAVALFCYYLKKFISKSFIPKEKKW